MGGNKSTSGVSDDKGLTSRRCTLFVTDEYRVAGMRAGNLAFWAHRLRGSVASKYIDEEKGECGGGAASKKCTVLALESGAGWVAQ